MKGGYQIIDIRKLNLTLSNTTHSITDAEILEQLRSLRAYIQKGHDFTKPLDNALKCIQIRYRDQKNGEKLEACQWANIETSNNSLTYEIKTKNLMIEIVFEEKTDEYDNKYYDIKTAKYLYNHNEIIEGNLTVGGNLTADEINGEENPSVKPIYCHPINLGIEDGSIQVNMTMLIFNNDGTPFTFATFNEWLSNLADLITNVRIMISGFYFDGNNYYPTTMLYANNVEAENKPRQIVVRGSTFTGGAINKTYAKSDWENLYNAGKIKYFTDGVNKIN